MKTMKRLACLLLCVVLTLCCAAPAFAEEGVTETAVTEESMTIFDTAALEKIVKEYCAEKGINPEKISIAYCYTGTGECWYYNADKWIYAASTYKLPLMMLCAEKVSVGSMTKDTKVADITLDSAMERILVKDNDGYAREIREMLGGNEAWRQEAKKFSALNEGYYTEDFVSYFYVTARYMLDVVKTLYENPASYPGVVDYMKQAKPEGYISKSIDAYEVAQSWGYMHEANGTGAEDNNAVGIIYTPTPVLLAILTKNVGASDKVIGDLSKAIADYSVTLDANVNSYLAEKEAAAKAAAEKAAAEKAAAEAAAAEAAAQVTPAPTATPAPSKTAAKGNTVVFILIAVLVLAAAGAALVYMRKRVYNGGEEDTAARKPLAVKQGRHAAAPAAAETGEEEPELDIADTGDGFEEPAGEDEEDGAEEMPTFTGMLKDIFGGKRAAAAEEPEEEPEEEPVAVTAFEPAEELAEEAEKDAEDYPAPVASAEDPEPWANPGSYTVDQILAEMNGEDLFL